MGEILKGGLDVSVTMYRLLGRALLLVLYYVVMDCPSSIVLNEECFDPANLLRKTVQVCCRIYPVHPA